MGSIVLRSEVTLKEDQLRAIGCVAVESTYLEDFLDNIIQVLCCLDEHDFRVLTAEAPISEKLHVVKMVTKSRLKPEFYKRHQLLFNSIQQHITDRNTVIHGSWHVPVLRGVKDPTSADGAPKWIAEGKPFAMLKNRGKTGAKRQDRENIMEIARKLAQSTIDLVKFLSESALFPPQFVRSERPNQTLKGILGSASTSTARHKGQKKDEG